MHVAFLPRNEHVLLQLLQKIIFRLQEGGACRQTATHHDEPRITSFHTLWLLSTKEIAERSDFRHNINTHQLFVRKTVDMQAFSMYPTIINTTLSKLDERNVRRSSPGLHSLNVNCKQRYDLKRHSSIENDVGRDPRHLPNSIHAAMKSPASRNAVIFYFQLKTYQSSE